MSGREFLDIASTLLTQDDDEAALTTSTGRSYCAAHLEVREFCEFHGDMTISRSAREHGVVDELAKSMFPATAVRLRFLRRFRDEADYDLGVDQETICATAQTAYDESSRVIAEVHAERERLLSLETGDMPGRAQ